MRTCSTRNKKKNHPEQNKFKMIFLLLPVYSDKNLFMIILLRQISGGSGGGVVVVIIVIDIPILFWH